MSLDLSKKNWAQPFWERDGIERDPTHRGGWGLQNMHAGYIREGQMIAMDLDFPGMTLAVPGDEAYITALGIDERDVVYIGTGGYKAHLLCALTRGISGAVIPLCSIEENARITAIMCSRNRRVFVCTGPGGSKPGYDHYKYDVEGEGAIYVRPPLPGYNDLIHEWSFKRQAAEQVAIPLPGEGIAAALLVDDGSGSELICGIGERSGRLFTCTLDGTVTVHDPVSSLRLFSRTLTLGPDGRVYGTGTEGVLWCFDPVSGTFENLNLFMPGVAGRDFPNAADSFAVDRQRGLIYGAGSADGVLFSYHPESGRIKSLGKPTCYRGVKGLSVTRDGRLFGMSGREDDIARLFCYDPDEHEMKDLGLVTACFGPRVYGYEFSSAVTGSDGQIFFGQHERGGHVWVYWPAIQARQPD